MFSFDYSVMTCDWADGRLVRNPPVPARSGGEAMCMATRLATFKPAVVVLRRSGPSPVAVFGNTALQDLLDLPEESMPADIVLG